MSYFGNTNFGILAQLISLVHCIGMKTFIIFQFGFQWLITILFISDFDHVAAI